jgi:hypothetical protein
LIELRKKGGSTMSTEIYVLINKETGAEIESTKSYLTDWFRRGFEVKKIKGVKGLQEPVNKKP